MTQTQIDGMLDYLIGIQYALQAVVGGCSREEYVAIYKESYRITAGDNYDWALKQGTTRRELRKALAKVQRSIAQYR